MSVLRTRDLFPGRRSHLLPDLILKWRPHAPVEYVVSDEIGEIHELLRTGRGGNHTEKVLSWSPGSALRAVLSVRLPT